MPLQNQKNGNNKTEKQKKGNKSMWKSMKLKIIKHTKKTVKAKAVQR